VLNCLTERKLVTFKLAYNETCPDDYEPPMFIPAPQNGHEDANRLIFTTHDVNEPPERMAIGSVDTRHLGWVAFSDLHEYGCEV
jgi:HORMA domain